MKKAIRLFVAVACTAGAMASAPVLAGPIGTTGSFSLTRVTELKDGAGGEFTVYNVKTVDGLASNTLTNQSYSADPATKNVPNPFPGGVVIPASFKTFRLEVSEDALLVTTNYFVVGSEADARADAAVGAYGVYAINNIKTAAALDTFITTKDIFKVIRKERAEDKDVSVPDGGTAAVLLGMSLIALGALRRKQ